jgi:acetolactate synthase I/II/III large subunit
MTSSIPKEPVFLLASCLGDEDTGGGLLYFDGASWRQIDGTSTTGLFYDGFSLTRVLWVPSQTGDDTAILRYDGNGLRTFTRVNGLSDPHDVMWNGREYVCVSSFSDSVVWVDPSGVIKRRFRPAPGGDCWHLNSLFPMGDQLFVSAFGRFEQPRGWVDHKMNASGVVFDLETGADVITGLCCPHTPRFFEGKWVLCNSARSELLFVDPAGGYRESVQLRNWTRGIAVSDSHIFVGESANRLISEGKTATVAVVCRATHRVLDRLYLPYREVYDLKLVSCTLLHGLLHSPPPCEIWVPPQLPQLAFLPSTSTIYTENSTP